MADSITSPPRRIMFLSGAGASASLGAGGRAIPQMPEWASELVGSLGARAGQLGLHAGMDGPAFEAALGRFLAFAASLPVMETLVSLGLPPTVGGGVPQHIGDWFNTARGSIQQIRQTIWRSLFENFGLARFDDAAVSASYQSLHELARKADGSGPESFLVHATTNYDPAIELAVESDDRLELSNGFVNRAGGGQATYAPNVMVRAGLDSTAVVPVLHLHGAVGWYLRDDGAIVRRPADDPYDDRMLPALLLPDDTKSPDAFSAPIAATWRAFLELLGASTHVIVLGHSLHDTHIVKALRARNCPVAFIAYGPSPEQGLYAPPDPDVVEHMSNLLPQAVVLPGRFGQRASWYDIDENPLIEWMLRTTAPTA